MRLTNSYTISLLGIGVLAFLGYTKGVDVSMAISGIVLAYAGSRSAEKAAMVHSASKDPGADTLQALDKINGEGK